MAAYFVLFLVFISAHPGDCVNETILLMNNANLTSLPWITSATVQSLFANDNGISKVDSFPALPELVQLHLDRNLLTAFPNVLNVSSTLDTLSLCLNSIISIPLWLISPMMSLRHLNMTSNLLSTLPPAGLPQLHVLKFGKNLFRTCPVFSAFSGALGELVLRGNPLHECTREAFAGLTTLHTIDLTSVEGLRYTPDLWHVRQTLKRLYVSYLPSYDGGALREAEFSRYTALQSLHVQGLRLPRIPNLLLLPATLNDLFLRHNPDIPCSDPMLPWVNYFRGTGSRLILDEMAACMTSPEAGGDFDLQNAVGYDSFPRPTRHGNGEVARFAMITPTRDRDALPARASILPGLSPLGCARECLVTPSCLMFYLENSGCHLTDANKTGVMPLFISGQAYFGVN